ncbi:MAG: histidinol-phosphate transaminase [Spirochaetes bacterium]|nr:histidinol-phosphate transaminase [Spirochaetota bacterium]
MFASRHVQLLSPYQYGEQPPPARDLIKLNTNENPYPAHASVARLLKAWPVERLRLYPEPTWNALRKAASKTLGVPPEYLAFGNGSDELIALLFRTFFDPEDEVVFTQYTYSAYAAYSEALGIAHRVLPMGDDLTIDLSLLDKLPGKVVFLTNPNAPTGIALPVERIAAAVSRHRNRLFIVDEAYADFWGKNCLPLVRKYPNLLLLRTFSKVNSLCGVRLGYAIGQPDLIQALLKVKDPYNVNALTQAIGVTVFQHYAYYAKNAKKISAIRDRFSRDLADLGFRVLPSSANFVMASLPGREMESLYLDLAKKRIFVRFFNKPGMREWVRISMGTPAQMKKVLAEIRAWLPRPG